MRKLIYSPDEILLRKCPECPVPLILSFSNNPPPLEVQNEVHEALRSTYGSPDFVLALGYKTLFIWFAPYERHICIKELLGREVVEKIRKTTSMEVYSGSPGDEVLEFLRKKGYLYVSSLKRWGITRKEKEKIKENAKAFAPIMNKLREEGLIQHYRVASSAIIVKKPNKEWPSFVSAWKTPKGYRVEGKFFRNPDDVREFLIWYLDLSNKKEGCYEMGRI